MSKKMSAVLWMVFSVLAIAFSAYLAHTGVVKSVVIYLNYVSWGMAFVLHASNLSEAIEQEKGVSASKQHMIGSI